MLGRGNLFSKRPSKRGPAFLGYLTWISYSYSSARDETDVKTDCFSESYPYRWVHGGDMYPVSVWSRTVIIASLFFLLLCLLVPVEVDYLLQNNILKL